MGTIQLAASAVLLGLIPAAGSLGGADRQLNFDPTLAQLGRKTDLERMDGRKAFLLVGTETVVSASTNDAPIRPTAPVPMLDH
eukprot:SAG11_NODE_182_length_13233_cov_59.525238_5_plen_83_part_00